MRSKYLIIPLLIVLLAAFAISQNRVKTVVDGEVILAADWNAEFDNIYANTDKTVAGQWTFTVSGTPLTITPASAPAANTVLLDINNAAPAAIWDVDYEGDVVQAGSLTLKDDKPFILGTGTDAYLEWNTDQTTDLLSLGLGSGNMLLIGEQGDMGTDYAIASQTDPTLIVHSADSATAKDYIWLQHDQTDAIVNIGAGGLKIQLDTTSELVMDSSGQVGINETSPSTIFHVSDDLTGTAPAPNARHVAFFERSCATCVAGIAIVSGNGTGAASYIDFGDTDSSTIGSIWYDHENDEMNLRVNNTRRWTLDASGRMEVGPQSLDNELVQSTGIVVDDNVTVIDASSNGSTIGLGVVTGTRSALTAGRTSAGGTFLDLELWAHGSQKLTIQDPSANDGDVLIQATATDHAALELDTQASPTAGLLHMKVNGTTAAAFILTATGSSLTIHERDLGNDVGGTHINLNRNSNGTSAGAGYIRFTDRGGTNYYLWVDDTGDLRVGTTEPIGSQDTSGTVVGTQS